MTYNVGQSKVRQYRQCKRAYYLKHHEELVRKKTRRPFLFGKVAHKMIEVESQGDDPRETLTEIACDIDNAKVFKAEKEMYGDIITDIGVIMEEYFSFHKDGVRFIPVPDEQGEMSYAEHSFAIPLEELASKSWRKAAQGIVFKGQVDGLAKTPNKLSWLFETKTFDKKPSDDDRWRNLQSSVYIPAVRHLGWLKRVDGVCWNYICSKPPSIPQLLKDGSRLSVKEITTFPSVVRATLKLHGLDHASEDAKKLLERAEQSKRDYFDRVFTPVNATVIEKIFDGFVETAVEMRDNAGKSKTQNIGKHCGWCDYEPLCRAELTGGDVEYVKSTEYSKQDPEAYRTGKRSDKLKVIG